MAPLAGSQEASNNPEGKGAGWCEVGGGEEVLERGPGHLSPVIALCGTNPGGAAAPEGSHTVMDTVFHVLFRDHNVLEPFDVNVSVYFPGWS